MSFVSLLSSSEDFMCCSGVDIIELEAAERELNLFFSDEYKEYLLLYGMASAKGHEFTGITQGVKSLNVVRLTKEYRLFNPNISESLYVVEELDIDMIVIWQEASGKVYETIGTEEPRFLANSIVEYLESLND